MPKTKIWYVMLKNNDFWAIWKNTEIIGTTRGSGGCKAIYKSQNKQDCINYCKENKIKLRRK